MQYPISQTPAGLLAIAIATATVLLLLGFATPAGAETTGGLQAAVDTVESSVTDAPPAPTAEAEPEATNTPEAVPQATSEAAPPATDIVDKVSEPVATATSQASKLADDVGQRAADGGQRTVEAVESIVESAASVESAADDGEALVTHAVSSSQDSLKRAGENLAETGNGLSSSSSALLSKAVLSASQAVSSARSATGLVFSPASQELPPPSAADSQTFVTPPADGSPSSPPDRKLPVERGVDFLESLFLHPIAGFGGIAPLHLWASLPRGDFFAGGDQLAVENSADGVSPSAASGVSANPNPLDGDDPLPPPLDLSQAAAPGLGGSPSFVPVAGLLALLALAAPATFRRLREMSAFAAPTPFVCALERPG